MSLSYMKQRVEFLNSIRYRWTEREEVEYFTLLRTIRDSQNG